MPAVSMKPLKLPDIDVETYTSTTGEERVSITRPIAGHEPYSRETSAMGIDDFFRHALELRTRRECRSLCISDVILTASLGRADEKLTNCEWEWGRKVLEALDNLTNKVNGITNSISRVPDTPTQVVVRYDVEAEVYVRESIIGEPEEKPTVMSLEGGGVMVHWADGRSVSVKAVINEE